jgi:hypothetical protein
MSCTGSNGDFCISIGGNSGGWTFSGANTGSGFYGHLQVKDHARGQGHGSGWGFALDTQGFVKVRLTVCHRWGELEVLVGGFRPSLAVTLSCWFLGADSAAIVTRA